MSIRYNIAANYIGRAYSVLSVYLFVPFYVGILGVEAYGVIALYAVLLTLAGLADLGLGATFSREAARRTDKSSLARLLGAAEWLLGLSVGVVCLLVLLLAPTLASSWLNARGALDEASVTQAIRLMALMLLPHFAFSLYQAGLFGLERQVSANALQIVLVTIRSGLVVPVLYIQPSLTAFFMWQLGASLAVALVARLILFRRIGAAAPWLPRFDMAVLRPHLKFAGGIFLIAALSALYAQLDRLIISRAFTLVDFGMYSFAAALAQVPTSIALPIATALSPNITAHLGRGDTGAATQVYERYGFLIAHGAALGSAAVALFAPEILGLWLPGQQLPEQVESWAALLAVGALFAGLQLPPYFLSLAHGQSRPIVLLLLAALVLGVMLAVPGAHRFGPTGVAGAMLVVASLHFVSLSVVVNRQHYAQGPLIWLLRNTLLPVALAIVPMVVWRLLASAAAIPALPTCIITGLLAVGAFAAVARHPYSRRQDVPL